MIIILIKMLLFVRKNLIFNKNFHQKKIEFENSKRENEISNTKNEQLEEKIMTGARDNTEKIKNEVNFSK